MCQRDPADGNSSKHHDETLSGCPARDVCFIVSSPGAGYPHGVQHPRDIVFEPDAITALTEIIGIMADQVMGESSNTRWEITRLAELEARLMAPAPGDAVTIGIDDAALLLDGMAFTEVMSIEFPWFEMVQWTSDFVTAELRQHWTEDEWRDYSSRA